MKRLNKRNHSHPATKTIALVLSMFGVVHIPAYAGVNATFNSTVKFGDHPMYMVEVTGNNPTGTIEIFGSGSLFYDEPGRLHIVEGYTRCKAPVLDGKATCVLQPMLNYYKQMPKDIPELGLKAVDPFQNIRIDYSGDANNPPSSLSLKQNIDYKAMRLSGTPVPANPMAGQDVVLNATVRTGEVNGSISFSRAGKLISGCESVKVADLPENKYAPGPGAGYSTTGVATCTVKAIEAGSQSIDLAYASSDGSRTQSAAMNVQVRNGGPKDQSGMYWNPAESGWGMSVVQHGDKQMNVIYGYDQLKSARWYVMPTGTWNDSNTEYRGALYQPTSAPYDAYNAKSFKVNDSVGEAVITYAPSGAVTLAYLINNERGSKQLTKQSFGGAESRARLSVADMWWGGEDDEREYGWGVSIAQQGNQLFPVWFTYDAQGKATWYPLMRAPVNYASYQPAVFYNDYGWYENRFYTHVYSLKGSMAPSENFLPDSLITELKGSVVFTFQDNENATMSQPVTCDGTNMSACLQWKKLRRQKF